MTVPVQPKIYHIVHVDRLQSIIADGCLWCDAEIVRRTPTGTVIGMNSIKKRRLHDLTLTCYPQLHVGDCVPFYFCPRSVMLYLVAQRNHPELAYRGGQGSIIHLESDLYASVKWALKLQKKWAFTLSNAGSYFFEDRCRLDQLHEINWEAVQTNRWSGNGVEASVKEGKQAEFLMEYCFPWQLIERIGVYSQSVYQQTVNMLPTGIHRPQIELRRKWYY